MDTELLPSFFGQPSHAAFRGPSSVYMALDDAIRLTSIANVAGLVLTLSGRVLGPDGVVRPFSQTHTPNSNRTTATTVLSPIEGWLLGAVVRVTTGTPGYGAVWVSLDLVRGFGSAAISVQGLANEFLTVANSLTWPGGEQNDTLDSAGNLRSITGTVPGAGAEISEAVPAGARWKLLSFFATLTTAAAVANRVPMLIIDDGAHTLMESSQMGQQAASLAWDYVWAPGDQSQASGNRLLVTSGLQHEVWLGAGFRIRTNTSGIQAADQWSAVQYEVLEWFDL